MRFLCVSTWLALLALSLGVAGILRFSRADSSSTDFTFADSDDYAFAAADIEVTGGMGKLKAASSPAWWDEDWGYRKPLTVTENAAKALSSYPVLFTLDTAALVGAGKMKTGGEDIRIVRAGTEIPYQIENGTMNTASTKLYFLLSMTASEVIDDILLYYGNPSATAPTYTDLLSSAEDTDELRVKLSDSDYVLFDKTLDRPVSWGKSMSSIITLWDGATTFMSASGCIRNASLQWLSGPSEGEIQASLTTAVESGPVFCKVRFTGNSANGDFSHVIRYYIFPGRLIFVESEITAVNSNPGGMDANRAPIPGVLNMSAELPNGDNGESSNEAWATLRSASKMIGIMKPGSPNTAQSLWGGTYQFDWLPQASFGGFGGWKMRPTSGNFSTLTGTASFYYAIHWTGSSVTDSVVSDHWARYTSRPSIAQGTEQIAFPTTSPTLINNVGVPFTNINSFSHTLSAANEGTVTYQISPDGTNWFWWDATANGGLGAWTAATGVAQSNPAATVNTAAAHVARDLGAGTFHFKAFLQSDGVQRVEIDSITVQAVNDRAGSSIKGG